jgi:hypothetical protein
VSANASAPRELAALFVPYMYLLQLDPVEHAATFAAGVLLFSVALLCEPTAGQDTWVASSGLVKCCTRDARV